MAYTECELNGIVVRRVRRKLHQKNALFFNNLLDLAVQMDVDVIQTNNTAMARKGIAVR